MSSEQRMIDANKAKFFIADIFDIFHVPIGDKMANRLLDLMDTLPTVDAVVVEDKELLKAIKILIKQYEHSKQSDYVHNPVAHAFYHAWKQLDERRKGE